MHIRRTVACMLAEKEAAQGLSLSVGEEGFTRHLAVVVEAIPTAWSRVKRTGRADDKRSRPRLLRHSQTFIPNSDSWPQSLSISLKRNLYPPTVVQSQDADLASRRLRLKGPPARLGRIIFPDLHACASNPPACTSRPQPDHTSGRNIPTQLLASATFD
jgi:hypothetical protein